MRTHTHEPLVADGVVTDVLDWATEQSVIDTHTRNTILEEVARRTQAEQDSLRGAQSKRPAAFWRGVGLVREEAAKRWPQYWLDHGLLGQHRLSSEHVEPTKSLPADVCMVRRVSSTRIGPACG